MTTTYLVWGEYPIKSKVAKYQATPTLTATTPEGLTDAVQTLYNKYAKRFGWRFKLCCVIRHPGGIPVAAELVLLGSGQWVARPKGRV